MQLASVLFLSLRRSRWLRPASVHGRRVRWLTPPLAPPPPCSSTCRLPLAALLSRSPLEVSPIDQDARDQTKQNRFGLFGGRERRWWRSIEGGEEGDGELPSRAGCSRRRCGSLDLSLQTPLLSDSPLASLASHSAAAVMIRAFPVLLLLSLSTLLLLPVHGLYFHIVEGTRKCFIEEVPEDVLVLGRYTSPDFGKLSLNQAGYADGEKYAGIKVTVTDPRQDVLLTHDTSADGKFAFTSVVGGEHVVCLATNTSSWYGQTRTFVSCQAQIAIGRERLLVRRAAF